MMPFGSVAPEDPYKQDGYGTRREEEDEVIADIDSDNNPTFEGGVNDIVDVRITNEQGSARIVDGHTIEYTMQFNTDYGNGDNHVAEAGAKWAFDDKVTAVFDKMLEASIPNYQEMRRLTFALGKRFIPEKDGVVIDIGASRGDALAPFIDKYPDHNYYGVEVSEPMREVMKQRFTGPNMTICDHDLRYNHSVFEVKSDLILSVLTLMFIPIELRQRLLQAMYDSLKPGAALILVEKCLGADSYLNDMLVEEYYAMKRDHGYTAEQISRKKMALEGVLVPVTVEWNYDLLKRAGFRHIDVFWRSLMFTGFIAVKE